MFDKIFIIFKIKPDIRFTEPKKEEKKVTKRIFSVVLTVITAATLLTGCGMSKEKEKAETISVYLWSSVLYDTYAPYIQSQLPDVNTAATAYNGSVVNIIATTKTNAVDFMQKCKKR